MKNLKIAGLVVGLHALALVLIFVNPGCSSTSKPAPVATEPAGRADAPPAIALATAAPAAVVAVPEAGPVRYSPTRPGTPVAVALEAPPVTDVTPATTYVVVKGDTLSTIARRHHLTMAEVRAANGLKSGAALQVGQKLVLPSKPGAAPAAATATGGAMSSPAGSSAGAGAGMGAGAPGADRTPDAAAPKAPVDGVKHVVKAGETLGSIARHYGVRLGDVAAANNIADPKRIRPGQELIIPGRSAAKAAKGGKAKAAAPGSTSSASASATAPATAAEAAPAAVAPASGQDLDAGLKSAAPGDVPIVKVEDGSAPPPKTP
jgi:LysM repeat protein